jgi:hypothetical protein
MQLGSKYMPQTLLDSDPPVSSRPTISYYISFYTCLNIIQTNICICQYHQLLDSSPDAILFILSTK